MWRRTDAGDRPVLEPAPGEAPLWQDTRISGLFTPEADFAALRDDLLQTLEIDALPAHEIQDLGNRAWEREWLKDFAPMRFGSRLWICPGDSEPLDEDDAVIVRLDPGLGPRRRRPALARQGRAPGRPLPRRQGPRRRRRADEKN